MLIGYGSKYLTWGLRVSLFPFTRASHFGVTPFLTTTPSALREDHLGRPTHEAERHGPEGDGEDDGQQSAGAGKRNHHPLKGHQDILESRLRVFLCFCQFVVSSICCGFFESLQYGRLMTICLLCQRFPEMVVPTYGCFFGFSLECHPKGVSQVQTPPDVWSRSRYVDPDLFSQSPFQDSARF